MNKALSAFTVLSLIASYTLIVQAAPSEIYLVRHAEKLQSLKDPALSPCGIAQAQAMAKLIPAQLSTIYHSGYQRTLQTAQQIALTQLNAKLESYNAGDLTQIAKQIQQQASAVLVVGHSNTTPELIQRLGQLPAPQIKEQDYGVVYQLKQSEQGYQLFSYSIKQPAACSVLP